jgi:hypothetical protein
MCNVTQGHSPREKFVEGHLVLVSSFSRLRLLYLDDHQPGPRRVPEKRAVADDAGEDVAAIAERDHVMAEKSAEFLEKGAGIYVEAGE